MADGKQRQSNNAKVATPKVAGGGATAGAGTATSVGGGKIDELDVALSKAIGARVKITTSISTLEGTLFTSCPITNLIAINTTPAPPTPNLSAAAIAALPGDYHIVPVAHIAHFQVLTLPTATDRVEGSGLSGFDGALPSISRVDHNALRAREEAAVRKIKERDAARPKGVSKEGYDAYDAVARTLPAYWAADGTIVVNDTVRINKPYGVADVQAAATNAGSLQQVKKILEAHYAKQKSKAPQHQQAPASNRNSVATPLAPRKGG